MSEKCKYFLIFEAGLIFKKLMDFCWSIQLILVKIFCTPVVLNIELELLRDDCYILGLDSPLPWALVWFLAWDVFGHSPVLTLSIPASTPFFWGVELSQWVIRVWLAGLPDPALRFTTGLLLSVGVFSGQSWKWMNEWVLCTSVAGGTCVYVHVMGDSLRVASHLRWGRFSLAWSSHSGLDYLVMEPELCSCLCLRRAELRSCAPSIFYLASDGWTQFFVLVRHVSTLSTELSPWSLLFN